jgi:Na+-driven multidrug efflux pump
MIGIGSATRYCIIKSKGKNADCYFGQSLMWSILFSIPFVLCGILFPANILKILGADASLVKLGTVYLRIVLLGSPFFMSNHTFTAFTRNDDAPSRAMLASIIGSLFNIVFDYIFMFPMNMGLAGAALATALSPVVTMSVCSTHLFGKKSQVAMHLSVTRKFFCINGPVDTTSQRYSLKTVLTSWVGQPGGFEDLLFTLHILFGDSEGVYS